MEDHLSSRMGSHFFSIIFGVGELVTMINRWDKPLGTWTNTILPAPVTPSSKMAEKCPGKTITILDTNSGFQCIPHGITITIGFQYVDIVAYYLIVWTFGIPSLLYGKLIVVFKLIYQYVDIWFCLKIWYTQMASFIGMLWMNWRKIHGARPESPQHEKSWLQASDRAGRPGNQTARNLFFIHVPCFFFWETHY